MKTPKEIEQLAIKLYPISPNPNQMIEGFERVAYKKGYTQCQEDMTYKWIKTSEQHPERLPNVRYSNPKVIVWYKGEVKMLCFNHEHECWDDEYGDDYCCDIESVEYWMPLPNKPLNKQD